MGFDTYIKLDKLLQKFGPKIFGSICQFMLELSFRKLGYQTRGRAVERPDIVAQKGEIIYAIESKCQAGQALSLTKRDLDGVLDYTAPGCIPIIAFLFIDISSEWILAKADKIPIGKSNKIGLKIFDVIELSKEINSIFPQIVEANFEITSNRGLEGIRSKF